MNVLWVDAHSSYAPALHITRQRIPPAYSESHDPTPGGARVARFDPAGRVRARPGAGSIPQRGFDPEQRAREVRQTQASLHPSGPPTPGPLIHLFHLRPRHHHLADALAASLVRHAPTAAHRRRRRRSSRPAAPFAPPPPPAVCASVQPIHARRQSPPHVPLYQTPTGLPPVLPRLRGPPYLDYIHTVPRSMRTPTS